MAKDVKQRLPAADVDVVRPSERNIFMGMHTQHLRLNDGKGMWAADFPLFPTRCMGRNDAGLKLKRAFGNPWRTHEVGGQGSEARRPELVGVIMIAASNFVFGNRIASGLCALPFPKDWPAQS